MSGQRHAAISAADIQSLGERLEQFRQGLPAGEQAALAWLIQRAAMAKEDTGLAQGYALVFEPRPGVEAGGPVERGLPFRFETTWSLGTEDKPAQAI